MLGKCVAYVAVIEWPHCHLVTFNSPKDRPISNGDIDSFVSAELPDPIKMLRLHKAVTSYMYHHRCHGNERKESFMVPRKGVYHCARHPKGGAEDTGKRCFCHECGKRFPKKFADKSEFVENSYPVYRRRCNGRTFMSTKNQIDGLCHTILNYFQNTTVT